MPAAYSIRLLSPAAGDLGESAASHSGGFTLIDGPRAANGALIVQADSAANAARLALAGTLSVFFQEQAADYPVSPAVVGDTAADHLPFLLTQPDQGQSALWRVALEDLTAEHMQPLGVDWDYDDRSWDLDVRPHQEPVPGDGSGLLTRVFAEQDLAGLAALRVDPLVDFRWGDTAPAAGVPADHFSVRWTGQVQPQYSDWYTLYTTSDDGVRLWLNDQLLIDNWTDHGPTTDHTEPLLLSAGQLYTICLEYYENGGGATAQLGWVSAYYQPEQIIPTSQLYPELLPVYSDGSGNGLLGVYHAGMDLSSPVAVARIDPTVGFNWGGGSPGDGLSNDSFAVAWSGQVQPRYSGDYRFYTRSDDGVRLWLNGQLLIDNWTDHGTTTDRSAALPLLAGQRYDVRMEYYENSGGALAQLYWSSDNQLKEVIPTSQLYADPFAQDDFFVVLEGSNENIVHVLNNDSSEPDVGEGIRVSQYTQPNHGTVSLIDGLVVYTPTNGYNGPDSFGYAITDIHGSTAAATAHITVIPIPTVTVYASDPDTTEAGTDPGIFTVSRTGNPVGDLIVYYELTGTATIGLDFTEVTGMMVIPNGAASATITISPLDDDLQEGMEQVAFELQPYPGYAIGESSIASVYVADNGFDTGPLVSIVATDPLANEVGAEGGLYTLMRTGDVSTSLTVDYEIGGLAENGVDYELLSGSATFTAGSSTTTLLLIPVNDLESEGEETVLVTLLPSFSYQVAAEAASAIGLIADNPAGTSPAIWILDYTKSGVPSYLRIAKWNGAYEPNGKLRNTLTQDIFSEDRHRFHIRVKDPAKAGMASIEVKVSTDSPGTEHDDGATTIVLWSIPNTTDEFETAEERGIILVSNAADNAFSVDGIANDAPGDRTHLIALGGLVWVEYASKLMQASAPALGKVSLNINILIDNHLNAITGEPFVDLNNNGIHEAFELFRDIDGDGRYTPRLQPNHANQRVEYDLKVANETYAQTGIRFDSYTINWASAPAGITNGILTFSPALPVVNDANLTISERALLQGGFNSNAPDDMEIYYLARIIDPPNPAPLGVAYCSRDLFRQMTTPDFYDSLIMASSSSLYTLAHEMGHVLMQKGEHMPGVNVMRKQPMLIVSTERARITDTKRFTASQEGVFFKSEYVKRSP